MDSKPPITNEEIIAQFKKALAVMEVENANPFRIRAYQNAMAAIQGLGEELWLVHKRQALDKIPAIGADLASKIEEILESGSAKEWVKLYKHVPSGMFALLDIPSIGPKRAHQLAKAFNLDDEATALDTLAAAAKQGAISKLEGFGDKLEQEIADNLNKHKPKSTRMRIDEGEAIAAFVLEILHSIPEVIEAIPLGSLRRGEETVGDVDIAVKTNNPEAIMSNLREHHDEIVNIRAMGTNVVRLVLVGNKQADIKFQTPDKFGATLQHFTGSKFHNIALREYAIEKGMSLSEHGIKHNGSVEIFSDEQSFYSYLDLPWIPPELRQNEGEIEAAEKNMLPTLVELHDIQGDLHTHTNYPWSSSHDYGGEIEQLLSTAQSLGYAWIGVGDHNPSQTAYTHEDMIQVIRKRNEWIDTEVDQWQEKSGKQINVLKTLEVDILPNGQLAVPDEALQLLDVVIVSIHSRMALNMQEQTQRIMTALNHPKVKIFGHPTGRLINSRPGISIDWEPIFEVCLSRRIALEINAQPQRLDLPDNLVRQAVNARLKLSINTDAHQPADLHAMRFGVTTARRGWAEKSDIINTYSYPEIMEWARS